MAPPPFAGYCANGGIGSRRTASTRPRGAESVDSNGGFVPKNLEFGMTIEPHAYDPPKAKKLLAEAGYPNGFDGGDFHSAPPYHSAGEAVAGYMQAVGIRTRQKTMERAAFLSAWNAKTLRGVCMCAVGTHGNAATRMSQFVPSEPT